MYTPGFAPPELYAKSGNAGPVDRHLQHRRVDVRLHGGAPPQPADQRKNERPHGAAISRKLEGVYSPELMASGALRACASIRWRGRKACLRVQKACCRRTAGAGRAGSRLARKGRPAVARPVCAASSNAPRPSTIQENIR